MLVDRVVDDLEDEVVQTRAVIGVADVHAGALANAFESLQDADRGIVVGASRRVRTRRLGRFSGVVCHATAQPFEGAI
jgi:phosphoribosylformylglycinamidine (FGAM) synthase-like enzyme